MPKADINKLKIDNSNDVGKQVLSQKINKLESEENIKSDSDYLIELMNYKLKTSTNTFEDNNYNKSKPLELIKDLYKPTKKANQFLDNDDIRSSKRKGIKSFQSKTSNFENFLKSENLQNFDINSRRKPKSNVNNCNENFQNSLFDEPNFNETQNSVQALLRHSNFLKEKNYQLIQDIVDERNSKELLNSSANNTNNYENLSQLEDSDVQNMGNVSTRSQLSLKISHQSSNDSEKSFSQSICIASNKNGMKKSNKLEQ